MAEERPAPRVETCEACGMAMVRLPQYPELSVWYCENRRCRVHGRIVERKREG